jgi:pyruvate dehydrogenase E2 component (dihydrolipoamide acetyltransferase)
MARLLRMPEVAANAVDAILAGWPIAENIAFGAGDAIATVETDKAIVDVPAEVGGVILKQLVLPGAQVSVGDPIAILGDVGEPADNLEALLAELGAAPKPAAAPEPAAASVPEPAPATERAATPVRVVAPVPAAEQRATAERAQPVASTSSADVASTNAAHVSDSRIFSSPLARRLAKDAGISLVQLTGTGQGGRVVRRDVDMAIETKSVRPAVTPASGSDYAASYVDVPHTRLRLAIAARLTASVREAPHFYLNGTARVDKLLKLRSEVNEAGSIRVSVNDLVIMAAARAHVAVPAMNVIWTPDALRAYSQVDISVAVATDRGLVTPVLRGVERMTLSGLAAATSDLVARARLGKLRQEELEGGTLTVTNLGVYGTAGFAAIINPPQAAILAVGVAKQQPMVVRGKLRVATQMNVTLSVDHRPVDGAIAAQWMAAFLSILETPVRILV